MVASLPPVTAVVLAGCLWLALRPPGWLVPDRYGRRLGVAMALVLVAGFLVASRLGLRGVDGPDAGIATYLFLGPILVVLALWVLPFGVIGAAAGSARPRRLAG
jgi:uncharacterized membrane protein YtjA (UPF0391 family)